MIKSEQAELPFKQFGKARRELIMKGGCLYVVDQRITQRVLGVWSTGRLVPISSPCPLTPWAGSFLLALFSCAYYQACFFLRNLRFAVSRHSANCCFFNGHKRKYFIFNMKLQELRWLWIYRITLVKNTKIISPQTKYIFKRYQKPESCSHLIYLQPI